MLRFGKPALAFAVLLTIGVVGGSLFLREPVHPDTPPAAERDQTEQVDVRTSRLATGQFPTRRQPRDISSTSSRSREAGVQNFPDQPTAVLPEITGYVVDRFDTWTTIPVEYRADGIALNEGAITLACDTESTAPRSGMLASPPISLRTPALAGPAEETTPLEEGAVVEVEISLSEDGNQWSPWVVMEKYHRPDGRRVVAPMQASLAKGDLNLPDSVSSETVSGPSLRYRLHLSSSGVAAPSVADVRIWKRELQ